MPARKTLDQARAWFTGPVNGCWSLPPSVGGIDRSTGYTKITVSGVRWLGHRLSYTLSTGPIPPGLTIDHLCHNRDLTCNEGTACSHRACVNPNHLEAVPAGENALRGRSLPADNARKELCPAGHEYGAGPAGRRRCARCRISYRQTVGEVSARGRKVDRTHCPQGHPYSLDNTYVDRRGCRHCRACNTERARKRRARRTGDAA